MAISKVNYGKTTLIDLTSDTVVADKMIAGTTAHGANGEKVTGTMIVQTFFAESTDPDASRMSDGDLWIKL